MLSPEYGHGILSTRQYTGTYLKGSQYLSRTDNLLDHLALEPARFDSRFRMRTPAPAQQRPRASGEAGSEFDVVGLHEQTNLLRYLYFPSWHIPLSFHKYGKYLTPVIKTTIDINFMKITFESL